MEDQSQDGNNSPSQVSERSSEPVRSRWTPKPEQILILESIFNSGMVNPPKDETVRIRKLLENFGSVGDANVFYWFQNRRSRCRRRQRQLQASLIAGGEQRNHQQAQDCVTASAIQYENYNNNDNCAAAAAAMGFLATSQATFASTPSNNFLAGSSSYGAMGNDGVENLYSLSGQMGFQELEQNSSVTSMLCPSESSNLQYHIGFITVFINGVPTEIPSGPIDMKASFGQDVVLVHSSGVPIPTNEFGFLMQSLQHGESYFLVSRSA